ncbi:hypothetical protein Pmani_013358 [Petrolisthes manimaculis]|uniref:C-type lectin domain-containing protein n=1 Tax=Petrolisthes manimaculis TaxID=1843537 RepID=A0AAE1UC93_9EUCA|nr:hypothetical protein Pmani_013358 [Petrolisthes manimaculis]
MTNNSWAQSVTKAPPSASASVCVRFKVFFFRPLTHVFSLTSLQQTREINGEIFVDYVRPIVSGAFYFLGISEPLQVLTWYHYCLTYHHTQAHISAYLQGHLIGTITRNITRWFGDATLVLGQYSLGYLDGYTKTRSFSGQVTHVGVWGRTLSSREVLQVARCHGNPPGLVISWDDDWILNNSSFVNLEESEICERKEPKSKYIKLFAMPYHSAVKACAGLGGFLPVPLNLKHARDLLQVMKTQRKLEMIWVGATDQLQEGVYISDHTGEEIEWQMWGGNDPNGLQWQNCLILDETFLHDYPCHVSRDSLCYLPSYREWTLKGPCEEDTANYKYSLLHPDKGQLVFRGYYQYEIIEKNESWLWRNVITDNVIARLPFEENRWPMGSRNWTLETEVCGKRGKYSLQLSSCLRHEFTCRDGSCIPRTRRCNQRPDCRDGSDEWECILVNRPTGYHHTLPPPSHVPGTPLPVTLNIRLLSLSLSDKDSYLEVTYHLNLTWKDLRLRFHNLKSASRLNQVPVTDHYKLWTPTLTLVNVRGTERTRVDEEAVITVHRRGVPIDQDLSLPEDVDIYQGAENHLSVDRKYTSQFLCDLNLQLYPFDTQHCLLYMQVLSAATDFVLLDMNGSFVTYEGAIHLIEYTVISVSLQTNNSNIMGEAEVSVELQRRVGYPVISIYVPTVILLILAYLSLIFRQENFEARVMSSLTVLLVLAALFTQTSTSLPKTSYFKMVDVWLLFSISLIFFVILFHVLIDLARDGKLSTSSSSSNKGSGGITEKEHQRRPQGISTVKPITEPSITEGGQQVRSFITETGQQVRPFITRGGQQGITHFERSSSSPSSITSRWFLSSGTDIEEEKNKTFADKLFKHALIFIPCYFGIFNFIYWIYIFA